MCDLILTKKVLGTDRVISILVEKIKILLNQLAKNEMENIEIKEEFKGLKTYSLTLHSVKFIIPPGFRGC